MSDKEIHYLSLPDVIAIHYDIMERTEQPSSGLRDEGLLESAIMRPQITAYYNDQVDIIGQAAILAISISQAQAFVDGNKRTAFASCVVFLGLNAYRLPGNGLDFARQLEAVAERTDDLEAATARFEGWLRDAVSEIP